MNDSDTLAYRVADSPWPPTLGSHRAVVRVAAPVEAVLATFPWRRRDQYPERKDVVIIDCATMRSRWA